MLAWWGPRAATAAVADVWHRPGQEPALRAVAPGLEWPSAAGQPGPASPASPTLAGIPGLSPQLVSLLAANYALALGDAGTVAGRAARVVTVRRSSGSLAARFWLDSATKLPLRRETYSAGGGLLSEEAFLSLSLSPGRAATGPQTAQAWHDELDPGQLASLHARGWPVPGPLPGNLALVDARENRGTDGPVIHLAYSDGLSEVSVFVERGSLAPRLAGWSRTAVAGHPVYAGDPDDGSVAWSARGFVFTVITQAPATTLSAVVGALPHDPAARPGPLARMWIGARRLAAWLGVAR
jgi:sigma-E factor negative regulatory protein RseB